MSTSYKQYLNVSSNVREVHYCGKIVYARLYSFKYYTGSEWKIKNAVQGKERHVGGSDIQQAPEEADHGVLPQRPYCRSFYRTCQNVLLAWNLNSMIMVCTFITLCLTLNFFKYFPNIIIAYLYYIHISHIM